MSEVLRVRNVVLIAGCYADAEAAIPLGVQLARLARAEITGVLAEDPVAHELPGGAFVPLVPGGAAGRMRAAFQADARAFEARLRRAALQAALGWRFRREAGALPEVLARLVPSREDVALLGYRRPMRLRGPVVVLGSPEPQGDLSDVVDPAVGMASALARAMRLPLMVLDPSGGSQRGEAGGGSPRQAHGARPQGAAGPGSDWSGGLGPVPARIAVPDVAAALRVLDRLAPTLVVLDSRLEAFRPGAELNALIGTARCPILLMAPRALSGWQRQGQGSRPRLH